LIDLHTHVLPDLDDGARSLEDSVALGRAAAADGVLAMAATPHVRDDFPTTPERMEAALAEVRRAFETEDVPVTVASGGEIAYSRLDALTREELGRFTLGGTGRYLLLELPYVGWPLDLEQRVFELVASGLLPVIAHPERIAEVQADARHLERAVAIGALVQVTAASLDGRLGRGARGAAERLLDLELAHMVASDAHTPDVRAAGLSAACESLADDRLARWLTEDVPRAILGGEEIPERPPRPRRRRLFGVF
jgi:protein-tyrosine phosphatase